MHHYFEAITNTAGQSLIGYFARVINPATQAVVTLASDNNGTPISVVSGVANMAKTDDFGNVSLYVEPGTYNLEIFGPDAVSFLFRVPNVAMSSSQGPEGPEGPPGPQGEGLDAVKAPTGSGLVGFVAAGTGSITRDALNKMRESVSVLDKGAKGDGTTNDTGAIVAADATAKLFGKDLFLPAGTYMIDAETRATTNWRGEAGTVIKYRGAAPSFTRLVYSSGVDGITFDGITFDGNVSADPGAWTNANYDSFTGASGLSVEGCKRPRIIRCRFVNTRQHGLRVAGCTGPVVQGCTTQRSRGAFGDGFYLVSNIGLSIAQCWADDYTRIGFVVDSFGDTLLTNHKISLTSLLATNGHDASIMYGGGEFNAGVWCEHTGDVEASGIFASSNTHRGINICTGSKTNGFPGTHAMVTLSNCQTVGGSWGIYVYSLGTLPVIMSAKGCTAKGARVAFEADAAHANDSYTWSECHADYDASNGTGRGYATEVVGTLATRPNFAVVNCTVSRFAETLSNLTDNGDVAATSDVGSYGAPGSLPASPLRLVVDNLRHVDDKPVYVRWFGELAHDVAISGCDLNVRRGGSAGGRVDIRNNTVRSLMIQYGDSRRIEIADNTILGAITAQAARHTFCDNEVTYADDSKVFLLCNASGKKPAVNVRGNSFSKPINASGPVLRLGFGTVTFASIIQSNDWYNDGAASTANPFIERAANTTAYFESNLADVTVTNMIDTDDRTGPEPAPTGVRRVAMH